MAWMRCSDLGCISCLAIGDVYGEGKNSLIVLSTEGYLHVFNIDHSSMDIGNDDIGNKHEVGSVNIDSHYTGEFFSPPSDPIPIGSLSFHNSYDPDENVILKNTSSEYQSNSFNHSLPKPISSNKIDKSSSSSSQQNKDEDQSTNDRFNFKTRRKKSANQLLMKSQDRLHPSHTWLIVSNATCMILSDIYETGRKDIIIGGNDKCIYVYSIMDVVDSNGQIQKELKLKEKWSLNGHVVSLNMYLDNWGRPVILATHHEGFYSKIDYQRTIKYFYADRSISTDFLNDDENGPTDIIHIHRSPLDKDGYPQDPVLFVMYCKDGTIKAQEESSGKTCWEIKNDRQLFPLKTMDITGNIEQDIVMASWDGLTQIIDQDMNSVNLKFEERIRAFTCGKYSVSVDKSFNCLVYLTFNDQLYVYYNLGIKDLKASSILMSTKDEIDQLSGNQSKGQIENYKKFMSTILYHPLFDERILKEYHFQLCYKK